MLELPKTSTIANTQEDFQYFSKFEKIQTVLAFGF